MASLGLTFGWARDRLLVSVWSWLPPDTVLAGAEPDHEGTCVHLTCLCICPSPPLRPPLSPRESCTHLFPRPRLTFLLVNLDLIVH